ncbi:MAG: betaine/proline/choline family ABC transporter ATP-binding protein [Proteobacteria bacterium]|jgi:glycine betaine/proline transport system ATP-binding protein|nr:betaine/proline/choline family ABC transporter ATP-binding protein [Pseudomonadota bacterium]MDA0951231.1 betaine/proline/choline family ABC transporter ATP-binding protein [Pseudomonadota bacterium]MDA1072296.1 betaine/proline/choline family ABC transporter ATP-binding protein [Pseudomonadota bacterium]
MMASGLDRATKLTCKNVWKVYGPQADSFFTDGNGQVDDPDRIVAQVRESGHIGAACDVSFDVHEGEIFIIMGLSGSGKSTIVRCLSRLVEPTAGEVILDGENLLKVSKEKLIDIRRHKMGMVFQNFGLLPHLSVLENVAFPLQVQGIDRAERVRRAMEMIELVGLNGRETSYPRQLSGGQQQRVGIARSLAVEPELWFLDEPFSALDPLIRRQMQDEFLRLQKMLHKTIVFITHDFLEALRLADRIAIMKDGRVVQIGTPAEVVMKPADAYVEEFTQDVPRVKVITAGDIMSSAGRPLEGAKAVSTQTTLEQLMPRFGEGLDAIAVTNESGTVVGHVTPQAVLSALASAHEEGSAL